MAKWLERGVAFAVLGIFMALVVGDSGRGVDLTAPGLAVTAAGLVMVATGAAARATAPPDDARPPATPAPVTERDLSDIEP